MNTHVYKLPVWLVLLAILSACKHPLAIEGMGDIVDINQSGHGCTFVQFEAADVACTENTVTDGYHVNYRAEPHPGWRFVAWEGPCGPLSESGNCRIDSPSAWVSLWDLDYSHLDIPATTAIFEAVTTDHATLTLNDTGLDWGGNYPSGNNDGCLGDTIAQQDCSHGRDYSHNDESDGYVGFSFARLDNDGSELPETAESWSCVKDNVTGLVWEVKTRDGGIHDQDNSYRWGGKTAVENAGGTYYSDWDELVDGSRAELLCGFDDWRVPTIKELENIRHLRHIKPATDRNYFSGALSAHYWSATPNARGSTSAWYAFFSDGNTDFNLREYHLHVRLVRGEL